MTPANVDDFTSWRAIARKLLASNTPPEAVLWTPGLFAEGTEDESPAYPIASVPKDFLPLAKSVALHRDEIKWPLLYRILYRLTHGERNLLKIDIDDDTRQANLMDKAVHRDMHKMKAFVRFRRVPGSEPEQFVAWHKPDHLIVRALAPWFADRFGAMLWSIMTPIQARTGTRTTCSSAPAWRVRKHRRTINWKISGEIIMRRSSIQPA